MYIMNGIVYGGEPEYPIKVDHVRVLPDMMMLISFNTGETRLFDATTLNGPVYNPLLDAEVFSNPIIDHGVVTWNDGEIDCSPEFMFNNSYEYSMVI